MFTRRIERIQSRARYILDLVTLMADEVARLNDELDALKGTVDAFVAQKQTALDALNKTVADLQAQLAAGPPGLTSAQGDAFAAKIAAITSDLTPTPPPVPAAK